MYMSPPEEGTWAIPAGERSGEGARERGRYRSWGLWSRVRGPASIVIKIEQIWPRRGQVVTLLATGTAVMDQNSRPSFALVTHSGAFALCCELPAGLEGGESWAEPAGAVEREKQRRGKGEIESRVSASRNGLGMRPENFAMLRQVIASLPILPCLGR